MPIIHIAQYEDRKAIVRVKAALNAASSSPEWLGETFKLKCSDYTGVESADIPKSGRLLHEIILPALSTPY